MNAEHAPLWDAPEVAEYLKVSERTLRRVRNDDPTFPPPIRVGGQLRWRPEQIVEWTLTQQSYRTVRPRRPGRRPTARVGR